MLQIWHIIWSISHAYIMLHKDCRIGATTMQISTQPKINLKMFKNCFNKQKNTHEITCVCPSMRAFIKAPLCKLNTYTVVGQSRYRLSICVCSLVPFIYLHIHYAFISMAWKLVFCRICSHPLRSPNTQLAPLTLLFCNHKSRRTGARFVRVVCILYIKALVCRPPALHPLTVCTVICVCGSSASRGGIHSTEIAQSPGRRHTYTKHSGSSFYIVF